VAGVSVLVVACESGTEATRGRQRGQKDFGTDISAAFTNLDVNSQKIQSLAGIEYFTSLEYLLCGDNVLTQLDISKNTALKGLFCSGNKLTSLDVSYNPELQILDVRMNWMPSESAVIGLNKDITIYFMFDPQIFSGNDITDQFKDANFLAAVYAALGRDPGAPIGDQDCSKLDYLDLRGKGIKDLSGVEYFTGIMALYCSDNQIETLDLSKNTALLMLECANNLLTTLDLSDNPKLLGVDCSNNHLTAIDFSKNPDMEALLATKNCMMSEAAIIGFDAENAANYEFEPQNAYTITAPTCEEQGFTTWVCSHTEPHNIVDHSLSTTTSRPSPIRHARKTVLQLGFAAMTRRTRVWIRLLPRWGMTGVIG
jgi:Leucine-rich repeat (LRR) protein